MHVEFARLKNMASDYKTSIEEGEREREALHNMPPSLSLSLSLCLFLYFCFLRGEGSERTKEKWRDFAENQAVAEGEMDPNLVLKMDKVQVALVYQ